VSRNLDELVFKWQQLAADLSRLETVLASSIHHLEEAVSDAETASIDADFPIDSFDEEDALDDFEDASEEVAHAIQDIRSACESMLQRLSEG
jgi:predicted RNA-binding Zn ribbon-like protein